MDVGLQIITCTSVEEFTHACENARRGNTEIPVLNNAQPWPIASLCGTGLQIDLENLSRSRDYVVLCANTRSALPAKVLSRALGAELRIVPLANLHDQALATLRWQPLMLVASREEATDALLFSLLDEFEAALGTPVSWETLPQFSLITARDLAALSWLVAKIVFRALGRAAEPSAAVLASFTPQPQAIIVKQLTSEQHSTREVDRDTALALLTRPIEALAYSTHGEDACASAGGGAVLCGLHAAHPQRNTASAHDSAVSTTHSGSLACGFGHGCLRAPKQVRLSTLRAPLLMLHACNSLRLADSSLAPDFNLGLEFLEGLGCAYVGALFTGSGALSGNVFMAALASGASLAAATNFANAILVRSRMDRSMFAAIGAVDHTVRNRPLDLTPQTISSGSGCPTKVASTGAHVLSLSLTHPDALALAQAGAMSLTAHGVFWFYRVEGAAVRVFLFRFPAPLENMTVTALDGEALRTSCLKALKALEHWMEVWMLARLIEPHRQCHEALLTLHRQSRDFFAAHLERLRFDGLAPTLLAERRDLMLAAADNAARVALDHFAPLLSGSFWLTSIMATEYRLERLERAPCAYCAGSAIRKHLMHSLHGGCRVTEVCPRCGIVSDLFEDGPISRITIDAPDSVSAGSWLFGAVKIELRQNADCTVRVRLCTHGQKEVAPTDEAREFRFQIPHDLPPHQYRIKVLAATSGSLNFASRVLFVKNGCAEETSAQPRIDHQQ